LKKFLRRFKKSTLIVTLVLALTIIGAGSAFAYYNAHTTTLHGNVQEAFTVTCTGGTGDWDGHIWSVDTYPGETEFITLRVANAGSATLTAFVSATGNCSPLSGYLPSYSVAGGGNQDITFLWVVDSSSPAGVCNTTINISR